MSSSDKQPAAPSSTTSRGSQRVRFVARQPSSPRAHDALPVPTRPVLEAGSGDVNLPPACIAPSKYTHATEPQWQFPVYHNNYPSDFPGMHPPTTNADVDGAASRRGSDDSDTTLADNETKDLTFSSYRHPYDIKPPPQAHGSVDLPSKGDTKESDQEFFSPSNEWDEEMGQDPPLVADRRPGLLGNLLQLYRMDAHEVEDWEDGTLPIDAIHRHRTPRPWGLRRIDSLASEEDQFIDPEDPTITGERKTSFEDPDDIGKTVLRTMTYRQRRKERQRVRIEFNITSIVNRQTFLTKLAQALMIFGAPSHRIESQLLSAARILEVDAEFIHIPGVIICSFGDPTTKTTETHFVKCGGRLSLGSLHAVHQIYRQVVHDEISAKQATNDLENLIKTPPIYKPWVRCLLAFFISGLICPLAFGGSFLDMWIAGLGAVALCMMQIGTASKSVLYQNVFEVSVTIAISFTARGLGSINGQVFCYTAISSAAIVCILPGYLILTSSLELASKNIVCGSVKMVYALIYTLFLGFGLQIGSDLFLLFDHNARDDLTTSVSSNVQNAFSLNGKFMTDNNTVMGNNTHFFPTNGYTSFTFTNVVPVVHEHIVVGCYRHPGFPWYLKPFPWWTQFIIVPLFSILSSLGNLQPLFTVDLIVMIVISCSSYAANKVANHFIFQRSDIVSAIGAFVVGLMGNIYSRKMGGTAFTVMVTGVLFLVPSGLSQAGGITAQGDGIEIGNAMVAVTIGITVGLFMSQAIVYTFGSRKNAAIFSF